MLYLLVGQIRPHTNAPNQSATGYIVTDYSPGASQGTYAPPVSHEPNNVLDSNRAIQALALAQGNINVAAEALKIPKDILIGVIVADPANYDTLQRYLRTLATIEMFDTLLAVNTRLKEQIGGMEAKDTVKALQLLTAGMLQATDDKTTTQNINVFETVIKRFPPHVQESLMLLAQQAENAA